MVACVLGYLLDLGSPRREFYSTCIKLGPQRHRKLGGGEEKKKKLATEHAKQVQLRSYTQGR